MPEYKVSTLYLGTKVGTGSLCARVFRRFRGDLPRSTSPLLLQHWRLLTEQSGRKTTWVPRVLYRARALSVKAPLDRGGDSFNSGSYQHETCTQN